jgi:hypothetical protein
MYKKDKHPQTRKSFVARFCREITAHFGISPEIRIRRRLGRSAAGKYILSELNGDKKFFV